MLAPNVQRLTGEAGFFDGLARAGRMLESGEARWVAVVAADSFAAPAYLAERQRFAASAGTPTTHGPRKARRPCSSRQWPLRTTRSSPSSRQSTSPRRRSGIASDENDAAPDGIAVATLLRAVPEVCQPVSASFGQHAVGSVRDREWELAAARCVSVLEPDCALLSLEGAVGALGAAASAAAFVYGVAVHQHDAWPTADGPRPAKPFIVWSISPSGACGLAAVTPEPMNAASSEPGLVPSRGTQRATWAQPHAMTLGAAKIVAEVLPDVDPAQGTPDASVCIDGTRAEPMPVWACQASVIADCLERMSMLGRHRDERPLRERASIEVRLLAHLDALVAAGTRIDDLDHFWQHHAEDDPWVTWAVVFVLGTVEGPDALDAIAHLVEGLPSDASDHAQLAAAALAVSPHADRALLLRGLLPSPSPLAKAVAVELLSILGVLELDIAVPLLDDPTAGARAAALRALARASTSIEPVLPKVRAALRDRDPAVAWEAARLLTLFQHSEPAVEVRDTGPLATTLGARALDLLALVGSLGDLPTVQRITKRLPMSGDVLSAVARFGHPAAWTLSDPRPGAARRRRRGTARAPDALWAARRGRRRERSGGMACRACHGRHPPRDPVASWSRVVAIGRTCGVRRRRRLGA